MGRKYKTGEEKSMSYEEVLEEKAGFTLKLVVDDDPQDPRKDYDPFGKMVIWSKGYNLGDEDNKSLCPIEDYLDQIADAANTKLYWRAHKIAERMTDDDEDAATDLRRRIYATWLPKYVVAIPLRVQDYGSNGLKIDAWPECYEYDEKQDSWLYATKKDILECFMAKRLTKQLRAKALHNLKCELETYQQYLEGDVWGHVIEDEDGDEVGDSCWGMFGHEYAEEEARSEFKSFLKRKRKEKRDERLRRTRRRRPETDPGRV
jgi:hypothetical protein